MTEYSEIGFSDMEKIAAQERGLDRTRSEKVEYKPKEGTIDDTHAKLISAAEQVLGDPSSVLTANEGQRVASMVEISQDVVRRLRPTEIGMKAMDFYLYQERESMEEVPTLKAMGLDTRGLETRIHANGQMADFSRRVSGGFGTEGIRQDPKQALLEIIRPPK